MPAISVFFKALRSLGFSQVANNALYRFGLATGHYRRVSQPPALRDKPRTLERLFNFPSQAQLLAALGQSGLQTLIAEADEIVDGKFRQFGADPVEIQLCPPQPLRHWTEYESHSQAPTSDIKFTWEPARFGWAFTLGRAYLATGDEKYTEAFWRYFEIFAVSNPPYLGQNWISGQEVGLRLMAFVWASQAFCRSEHSTRTRLAALAVSTGIHAARIPATLPYARSQNNNHLLTEATALYTAALALPKHPDSAKWKQLGQTWLNWCFTHQIDIYGEYVQHSTNYHRLMLQTALWVWSLTPDTSSLTSAARENLALATHWLFSLLDPVSGQVPNLGANDGAYILPLTVLPFNDYRPLIQAAARTFLGYSLPSGPWDEMSLWLGLPVTEKHLEIPRYPGGDHLYARNSWGYLRAVRYKSRPSHADQLHLDLWWRGLNITPDAGTYLYNADPPWDNRLTSTLVHNTVSVNEREQMTRVSRFLYLDWADARFKRHFETGADYIQRASAQTYAYARFGVRHARSVTIEQDENWLVEDELLNISQKPHTYRLHWLLPDWEWELEAGGQNVEVRVKSPQGWVNLVISADQPIKRVGLIRAGGVIHGAGLLSPTYGWFSPTYSVKIPALSLAVEVQSTDTVKFSSEFTFPTADDRQ